MCLPRRSYGHYYLKLKTQHASIWPPNNRMHNSRSGLALAAIRNISLQVEPHAIQRGQHATLRCIYDLGGAPLYSVKFYRGMREFYRYSPSEVPSSKIFAFPSIQVDVSVCRSRPDRMRTNQSCGSAAIQHATGEYLQRQPGGHSKRGLRAVRQFLVRGNGRCAVLFHRPGARANAGCR